MPIVCTNEAYDRIKNSDLYKILLEKRRQLDKIVLMHDFSELEEFFEKARQSTLDQNKKISENSEGLRRIFEVDAGLESDECIYGNKYNELLETNFSFLPRLILGNKVLSPEKFGFFSTTSLEKAVNSFALSREYLGEVNGGIYSWRNKRNNQKNIIELTVHGDWSVHQLDVSSNLEQTFFGEVFNSAKKSEYSGFSIYQDTSNFLIASLNYAKRLGKEKHDDILNWREVLNQVGVVATATAEAMYGSDSLSRSNKKMDLERPILGEIADSFPLGISGIALFSDRDLTYPYFEGDKLYFVKLLKEKSLTEKKWDFQRDKAVKVIEYTPEDLPHLLRASYRLFSRQRSLLPVIMEEFIHMNN